MKITDDMKVLVNVLLNEAYKIVEHTDNFIDMDIGRNGVKVYAMRGPFSTDKNYEISVFTGWDMFDDVWMLDTMRALMRLELMEHTDEPSRDP